MINKLKKTILNFTKGDKDVPLLAGFISGFYPFIYYYSENFYAKNSLEHFLFFSLLFIGGALIIFLSANFLFNKIPALKPYKKHMYFVLIIMLIGTGLSQAIYLTLKKKFLFIMLLAVAGISLKLYKDYKKLIVLVIVMATIPLGNTLISLYDSFKPLSWQQQPDDIETVVLKNKPNIYLIQPDGYVNQNIMGNALYNFKSDLYPWLSNNGFKLYSDFRSNYPATLLSNSSMFSMKHHYFGDVVFPKIEMINSRDVISGDSPVISILKNNGYKTYMVAQDEYFQMNNCEQKYDYINIELDEIPYFSHGSNVRKVLAGDIEKGINEKSGTPKFFFIEKLLPHHVMLAEDDDKLDEEREWYLKRVKEVNEWLKETVTLIEEKDNNSIIIILADHGGMVGMENYIDKYSNDNKDFMLSTFSVLSAIKWNGHLKENYDKDLTTNVNLFRVLFSTLSEEPKYLKHLEDNGSYNLNYENPYYNSVYKVIDDKGGMLLKPSRAK